VQIERVAEIRRMDGRIAYLTEVRATMSRTRRKARPAMMPAAMRVSTAMSATMMSATMVATTMTAAAMATTVSAFTERRARQYAGKCHRRNSNDRSQHRTLPLSHAIEASETDESWNRRDRGKFRDRDAASGATPPGRSCRG